MVHRYTAGSRSPGVLDRMALKAAVRQLMISRRFVVPAMLWNRRGSIQQEQQYKR